MKRILGVLVALAAVAGAAAGVRALDTRRRQTVRGEVERAAATTSQAAVDALRTRLRGIEGRAASAVTVQQLVGTLAQLRQNPLEGQLSRTLVDFFRSEPHWKPFRDELPVYGIAAEGDHLGLLQGVPAASFAADALIKRARESGLASDVVLGDGWPYAAAAARVTVAGLDTQPVLLLAQRLDEAFLKDAAARAGGTVAITAGTKILIASGPPGDVDHIRQALVRGAGAVDTAGMWAAASVSLAPGLSLWGHVAGQPNDGGTNTGLGIWAAAALVALGSIVFGFRRSAVRPARFTNRSGDAALAGTMFAGGAVPAPASNLPVANVVPGNVFGRYTLVEPLGEGGMSRVYTAVIFGAEGFRRKFVIKRLRPELLHDAAVVDQFIDEANLASTLIHSNIVPVLDFGKVGDEFFMATEYILGRDLGRVTQASQEIDGRPLPADVVLHVAHDTLRALEYAHTKTGEGGRPLGIVHRDVSPANVLISARGEVKLFDFGIVKAEGRVTKTQNGVVKGNVSFMSPEQAKGQDTDARADLFSLGLVMYYALTGSVLYQGNTSFELLVKAAVGPSPEDLAAIRLLGSPVADIITRALAVDPAERFQSAGAFADAIAPLIARLGNEVAQLVDRFFGGDFRAEEQRFSDAVPAAAGSAQAGSSPTGTRLRADNGPSS